MKHILFISLFFLSLLSVHSQCRTCEVDTFFTENVVYTSRVFLPFERKDLVVVVTTQGKETPNRVKRWVVKNIKIKGDKNMGREEMMDRIRNRNYRLDIQRNSLANLPNTELD
jgi:hypothetical protein